VSRIELVVGLAGGLAAIVVWAVAAVHAGRTANRPTAAATGLAQRLGARRTYLVGSIGYVVVCVLLWRPIPAPTGELTRAAMLAVGAGLGFTGWALYLWAHHALGDMYDLSSSLGTEVYAEQRLVTDGPYAWVRHPMYVAQVLAALGALLVYRTWTTVFFVVMLPAAVVKARQEDRLLAAELGDEYRVYRAHVHGWLPRPHRRAPRNVRAGSGATRR
jgi:protein-S-isoprenylcysteine O-methyltransferase Ste14